MHTQEPAYAPKRLQICRFKEGAYHARIIECQVGAAKVGGWVARRHVRLAKHERAHNEHLCMHAQTQLLESTPPRIHMTYLTRHTLQITYVGEDATYYIIHVGVCLVTYV